QVGTPAGTSFTDAGRAAQTTYAYTVSAVDGSGNEGPSVTASVTTPPAGADLAAPTAPTSLKARLKATTTRLYWTAARDNFGVTGYKVYRVGITKPIKTVSGTSVTVKRRNGARYYVRAFDTAGNLGPKSPTRGT
ncbi:MAG: alpha amylase, partial [Chloroflexota bacterium]